MFFEESLYLAFISFEIIWEAVWVVKEQTPAHLL